jgi:hypothetical protein
VCDPARMVWHVTGNVASMASARQPWLDTFRAYQQAVHTAPRSALSRHSPALSFLASPTHTRSLASLCVYAGDPAAQGDGAAARRAHVPRLSVATGARARPPGTCRLRAVCAFPYEVCTSVSHSLTHSLTRSLSLSFVVCAYRQAHVIALPAIESSFAVHCATGPSDYNDADLPALHVLGEYLSMVRGSPWSCAHSLSYIGPEDGVRHKV